MNGTINAFVRSWPWHPWLIASLVLVTFIYARGFAYWHRQDPARWPIGRLIAFVGAMLSIFLAVGSPIEPFSAVLLQIHMVQHLLLMMLASPLFWLSAPLFPLLRGLPAPIRTHWAGPLLRWKGLRQLLTRLTYPPIALVIYVIVTWIWHVPSFYQRALQSTAWHYLEHACFLAAAMLFWYGIVRPFPSRPAWSKWLLLPTLLLADVQNTILSAFFVFASRPLYSYYARGPRIAGISALEDQSIGGVLMWVPGSVAFLLPLFVISTRLMCGQRPTAKPVTKRTSRALNALPILGQTSASAARGTRRPRFDLLETPLVGHIVGWRQTRVALQLMLLLLALLIMADGFFSSAPGPMNLAGVLPWIQWRGLLVLVLMGAGNFFCMACPFTLPRRLLHHLLPEGRTWPRALQSKWLSIALIVIFFWAYEVFSLWNSPWLTAWIVLGYFATALAIDSCFRPGTFCKYVCPVGQFNFALSLYSPLTVGVRDSGVCATCATKECIRGSATIPGCALGLFQPSKRGNMDCTFCLDCVHACPHQNVGVLRVENADRWSIPARMNFQLDLAVLVTVIVFAAFTNAAGMVTPVIAGQERVAEMLKLSRFAASTLSFLVLFIAFPLILVGIVVLLSSPSRRDWLRTFTRYSRALLPLGFAMWVAHYGFHLATSYGSIVPTTQRFLADFGLSELGQPRWEYSCCAAVADWIPRAEILALDLGLLASLYVGYRLAKGQRNTLRPILRQFAPWAMLSLFLFAAGVWTILQPMEMRGMLPSATVAEITRAQR